jgi:ubiquinone/menaquinone biosynthesis C-methylase UbiE
MKQLAIVFSLVAVITGSGVAQQSRLTEGQMASAETEVPLLVEALALKPGMTVADVGAGFGAWTFRLSRWIGPNGRVFATEIGAPQLAALRDVVSRDGLKNVTIVEGSTGGTNLPAACCDALFIRDAYHHFTAPQEMLKSFAAALKPGGRLAIIDFPPRPDSQLPEGVPADRAGHGVPPAVVEREGRAHFTHIRTVTNWSPKSHPSTLFMVLFEKRSSPAPEH